MWLGYLNIKLNLVLSRICLYEGLVNSNQARYTQNYRYFRIRLCHHAKFNSSKIFSKVVARTLFASSLYLTLFQLGRVSSARIYIRSTFEKFQNQASALSKLSLTGSFLTSQYQFLTPWRYFGMIMSWHQFWWHQ